MKKYAFVLLALPTFIIGWPAGILYYGLRSGIAAGVGFMRSMGE